MRVNLLHEKYVQAYFVNKRSYFTQFKVRLSEFVRARMADGIVNTLMFYPKELVRQTGIDRA